MTANAETVRRHNAKQERIAKVSELVMAGMNGVQILKHVNEKLNWNCKQSIVWSYVQEANKLFADQAMAKAKDEFGKGLMRLNMLFASSLKIQDYKACLAIQKEINLMMGFTNKSITEITGQVNTTTEITQKIKIEYVHTGKKIATSEDDIDCKRLIDITDAQVISDGTNNIEEQGRSPQGNDQSENRTDQTGSNSEVPGTSPEPVVQSGTPVQSYPDLF